MSIQVSSPEAVAVLQLVVNRPNQQSQVTSDSVILSRAVLEESTDGLCCHKYVLRCATRQYVDSLLKTIFSSGNPTVQARLGLGNPAGQMDWLPWQNHIALSYHSVKQGAGSGTGWLLSLTSCDQLSSIARFKKTISRKGTVSQIVQAVAQEYRLQSVVEDTAPGTPWLYIQSNESDVEFVRTRMIPRAANAKGHGNYKFFCKDNALHFHTLDYQASLKQFHYVGSETTKLTQADNSQETAQEGASGVRVLTHDPYTGTPSEVLSDPESVLKLSTSINQTAEAIGAQCNIPYHLSQNGLEEARVIANNQAEQAKTKNFRLQLVIPKSLYFRIGDLINLVISSSSGNSSPWSGIYYVHSLRSLFTLGSLTSLVILERGEYFDNSSASTEDESGNSESDEAPGQMPNAATVNSSSLTRGSATSSSSGVLSNVEDGE